MEFKFRLKKLELAGFKSFCDRTTLIFPPGITVIVGPNGCGKSNLADAVLWALGEQSLRSLRARSGDDLIFAGSEEKKPVGMAEVSLHFSSEEDDESLIVTRRLYRSGECEYFLNRRPCRLKDIQDIILGTGMWTKGYLLFDQERVSFLLECRLEERRVFIEEAAGITKYKLRKHQAETKLASARENLVRLNDIILEVEKQRNSLKRQAAKARRYKEVRKRIRRIKALIISSRFEHLSTEKRRLKEKVDRLSEEELRLTTKISQKEAELEEAKTELLRREEEKEQRREGLYRFDIDLEKKKHLISQLKGELERIEGSIASLKKEISELSSRLEGKIEEKENLPLIEKKEQEELSECAKEIEGKEEHLSSLEEKIKEYSSLILEKKERLYRLREELKSKNELLEREEGELKRIDIPSLEEKKEVLSQRLASLLKEKEEKKGELFSLEERLSSLNKKREELTAVISELTLKREEGEKELSSLQDRLFPLKGRYHTISQLISEDEASFPSFGDNGFEVLGLFEDLIQVAPGYEKPVEAFLGELIKGMVVSTPEEALNGVSSIVSGNSHNLSFIIEKYPTPDEPITEAHPVLREEGVIAPLAQVVEASGVASNLVPRLFANAVLVDELEKAVPLSKRYPDLIFVSLSGERIGPPGVLKVDGDKREGILSLRREKGELEGKISALEKDLANLKEEIELYREKLRSLSREKEEVEGRIREETELRATIKEELIRIEGKVRELSSASGRIKEEIERRRREKETREKVIKELSVELAKRKEEINSYEEELSQLSEEAEKLAEEREELAKKLSQLKLREAVLSEKLSLRGKDVSRITEEIDFLKKQMGEAEQKVRLLEEEREKRLSALKEERNSLARLLEERRKREKALSEMNLLIEEKRKEVRSKEKDIGELRERKEQLSERLEEARIELKGVDSHLSHLFEECFEAFGVAPSELNQEGEKEIKDEEELKKELSELSGKLERMGGVNLAAEEEFERIDERYQFLLSQREDILQSISSLEEVIEKIDKASRERFHEAFTEISKNFSEVFSELFGGGRAELILTGDGDILEAGVDILAEPPGKRLKSISLLSGGEKTLSAIAFLFAIFRYHPSPFCILDEIDATLDDPNARRFSSALKRFSEKTQFIVITHNKLTMEVGEVIYGVTMREGGLSQIISIKLE